MTHARVNLHSLWSRLCRDGHHRLCFGAHLSRGPHERWPRWRDCDCPCHYGERT